MGILRFLWRTWSTIWRNRIVSAGVSTGTCGSRHVPLSCGVNFSAAPSVWCVCSRTGEHGRPAASSGKTEIHTALGPKRNHVTSVTGCYYGGACALRWNSGDENIYRHNWFLADRTATQYDRPSVCLSVCNAVRCGSQGPFTRLKVVPARSCSRQVPICPIPRNFSPSPRLVRLHKISIVGLL